MRFLGCGIVFLPQCIEGWEYRYGSIQAYIVGILGVEDYNAKSMKLTILGCFMKTICVSLNNLSRVEYMLVPIEWLNEYTQINHRY